MYLLVRVVVVLLLASALASRTAATQPGDGPPAGMAPSFITVTINREASARALPFRRMFQVLDGVTDILYTDGFTVQDQDGSQPKGGFSHLYSPDLGPYYMTQFIWDNTFLCAVEYGPQHVFISFYDEGERFSSVSHRAIDLQRQKIRRAIPHIMRYLRSHLPPSYHVTASFDPPAA